MIFEIRKALDEMGFFEIETPILTRSTPEGARDCLVPSRIHHGQFYALPQSPQIFKQILMISDMDRYFQICRCFRDEDFRADRQLEFTQLDLEMSFPRQQDIFEVIERVMERACAVVGVQVEGAVPPSRLQGSAAPLRLGQARSALRHGTAQRDANFSSRRARRCISKATCRRWSRPARRHGRASSSTSLPSSRNRRARAASTP